MEDRGLLSHFTIAGPAAGLKSQWLVCIMMHIPVYKEYFKACSHYESNAHWITLFTFTLYVH